MSICELLSPAGSPDTLIAAVESGADSVYLGGSAFNARKSAVNFDNEQLEKAVDYCHINGVKVLVTVNTLVNDRELSDLEKYLRFLNNIGVDGIIVQDLGVARIAKQIVPELPLHASTQMTVFDTDGARLMQELGFKRVVLARELSLKQIEEIRNAVSIEIECFIHGAICVCYSGQCLMSSFIGGRSGNRGACAQPCRLGYSIDNSNGFLLSPKDMGLINHIAELKKIGVNSLKIEGRMKGEDYVRTVVSLYRKYIDSGLKITNEDYDVLDGIFYRGGLTDGYFTGKLNNMLCHTKPDNPYLKQKKYTPPKTMKKREVSFNVTLAMGKPVCIKAECDGITVEAFGEALCEPAIKVPVSEDRIKEQIAKLGGTAFTAKNIMAEIDNGLSIPVSEINNVRRKAVESLEQAIINSYKRNDLCLERETLFGGNSDDFSLSVKVSSKEQAKVFKDIKKLYVPLEIYEGHGIAVLPRIYEGDLKTAVKEKNCKAVAITNIGQLGMFKDSGIDLYADTSLNIFNSEAAKFFADFGVKGITLSNELMLSQIRDVKSAIPLESVIYGYIPVMITKNCLIKAAVGCKNHKGAMLKDRTGTVFKIKCLPDCKNEIYNSMPIVMSDKVTDLMYSGLSYGRLDFTDEAPEECLKIYESYEAGKPLNLNFTRGKFYKGV